MGRALQRTTKTGYARGEETRARILNTSIALFGAKGFDGVSTREIASAAGVPPPSLQYYFDGKQGLYIACMDEIQATCLEEIGCALSSAETALEKNETDPDILIDAFCNLLESMGTFMLSGPDAANRARFVVRHALPSVGEVWRLEPSGTTGARYEACCAGLVRAISEDSISEEVSRIIAMMTNGQLTQLFVQRTRLEEGYNWRITPGRIELILGILRRQTEAMLRSLASRV